MSFSHNNFFTFLACLLFAQAMLQIGTPVSAQSIAVESRVVGKTPRVIGINSGNFKPGSNAITWWKWLGVNGARIFVAANRIESKDDIAPHGDGVTDKDSFVARRKVLRADPTNPKYIDFDVFEQGYRKSSGNINYALALNELTANGIEPLVMTARTNDRYPINDWADRWEHWQYYYAQAYYLGKNYGVQRYSMYNEPDHNSRSITQEDYLQRLLLASDAIQSALADVNRDTGKRLSANILAPITAGSEADYWARLKNSDRRDDKVGWGELVIKNLHTNFLGQPERGFQLIHTYAYQQYNSDGAGFASDLLTIKQQVAADLRSMRSRANVDFGLTEFNVHSNGVFSERKDSLDSPSRYARLGGILAGLASAFPQELYLFKFSSNAEEKELQKNAILHNSRFDAPYNVGGASRAAGVFKLFVKGFCGGQDQHAIPNYQGPDLYVITSYDKNRKRFFLFSVNESEQARQLEVDMSAWGVRQGAIAQIEEVSQSHLVEVTAQIRVPSNRRIRFGQPAKSAVLVSVPKTAAKKLLELTATQNTTVSGGQTSKSNGKVGESLTVRNSATSPADRMVSYIQFDTSKVGSLSVDRAVLQLHAQDGSVNPGIVHVYGINGDDWNETDLTWETAVNLDDTAGKVDEISHNFIDGINQTAHFVGHLSASERPGFVSVDVSEFVRNDDNQNVTFLLVREVRIDGENVDSEVRFASKENSAKGPKLLLELRKGL